jgi:D-threo-aldose 1-dehydrogenase
MDLQTPHKTLGATGIPTDAITVGTSPLGRGTAPGSVAEAGSVATAAAMLTGPFRLVDTSNEYAGGRSEEVLGAALRQLGERAQARIVTKVDRDPATGAFDRDRVLRSYEESLTRLGVDRVEVLHLHDPYTVTFDEACGQGGAIEGMRELRDSGAVDAIGIAAGPIPLMRDYIETGAFDVVLSHNRYTLVDRSAEPLFLEARRRGMGVFNAAPFGAGILATGARAGATYGYRPASDKLIAWAEEAEAVCARFGVSLQAVALHFSLRSPLVDSTVVGVSSQQRLAELAALRDVVVPPEVWDAIDALGPADSPLADER